MIFVIFFIFCLVPFFALSQNIMLPIAFGDYPERNDIDDKLLCDLCLEESKSVIDSFRNLSPKRIIQSITAGCHVISPNLKYLCRLSMREAFEKVLLLQPNEICSGIRVCPVAYNNCEACKSIYQHILMKPRREKKSRKPPAEYWCNDLSFIDHKNFCKRLVSKTNIIQLVTGKFSSDQTCSLLKYCSPASLHKHVMEDHLQMYQSDL